MLLCPCGSGSDYHQCCQPYISGLSTPASCEQLMRSRYTAFTLSDANYLWQTHHPDFRQGTMPTAFNQDDVNQWEKLQIILSCDFSNALGGIVEFKAYYRENGQLQILHERSNFIKADNCWFYTDGEFSPKPLARNSSCPCGSGKKLKQCCNKS
ncbi:YchJ family protein [Agarivorans sp. MS3-6]|uniref:YchJ family protein n=1 Tax=Agarivorans sp. TSD2052 TaxID=2937286 RepID=UPI00200DDAB4|nr:YchJ family metal-binding protein [Agarivorans sp. TSD2052]UPW17356.1 YchJ family metal-binding protein [Agarivorans sp. TSD2052]